ncbi:DEAD/DEAH box helicase [Alkalimarinus sediminis]|uniref:DEAD/DEAH box helicase n=1 Tax=Alkalimarinus sediminis TaxID=1632866 RepID=A0A9E8KI66_9ALTE|nr:DEAD/DEAH box helicase [Alkalimarinus sediminis]UZW73626.1 DEAD/DEAH box helicase [Alkalimarinus sediminis]
MDFSSLGLNEQLVAAVSALGYQTPTPIQIGAIPAILTQQDVMAGAQTGTGKTAAFALPILHTLSKSAPSEGSQVDSFRTIKALILTPTRELAQQVHTSFLEYGSNINLQTKIAYGGASLNPQIKSLKQGADILVATPGRLLDLMFKGVVKLDQLQVLVFDEADRMLDMGFSDEINRILKHIPSSRQTLLFSATFDQAIFDLSKTLLKSPKLIEVDSRNTAATQVEQIVYEVDTDRKRELTSYLIGSKNWHQVLIFTRTKQGADELAREMCKDGIKTQSIHGDKSQGARDRVLGEFKQGKIRALVATDVAARGLDIEQLGYVINYELPFIPEDYIHRIGRTGRAGASGLAISLLSPDENWLLEEIEAILDARLPQQWLPGYEPDLTKEQPVSRKNTRTAQKRRSKQRAFGKRTANRRG